MSSQFARLGPDAKLDLYQIPFGIVSGQYRISGKRHDVSDTEPNPVQVPIDSSQPGYNTLKPYPIYTPYYKGRVGVQMLEIECIAEIEDVNIWAAPLMLQVGSTITNVRLCPSGRNPGQFALYAPTVLVDQWDGGFVVPGSPPQIVRISLFAFDQFLWKIIPAMGF